MKCRSVACIWSGTPPIHRVTATTSLCEPPTLYTGGSDGSIIWWNISESNSTPEIKPIAMLCGHAAPIADLGICHPISLSRDREVENSDDLVLSSCFDGNGALISACTDGVLCVWSRSSGHCRRRRKLAPWVGSPYIIRTLPSSPRYVCVGCCFMDPAQLFDRHFTESVEGSEVLADSDSQYKKPSKCTVVIIDTYTLTIVETVFHGNLSIGPFRFMDVVSSVEEKEKHSVLMGDSFGRIQFVPLTKDSHLHGGGKGGSQKGSPYSEIVIWENDMVEKGLIVTLAVHRNIIVYLFRDHCIFRRLGTVMTIGEISFLNNSLFHEVDSNKSYVIGAMFLENAYNSVVRSTNESNELYSENFAVWNNIGSAVVYAISYVNEIFNFEPLFKIPAAASQLDLRSSFSVLQLGNFLLRVGSVCLDAKKPLLWQPFISVWSIPQKYNDQGLLYQNCRMLREGIPFTGWVLSSSSDPGFASLSNHKGKSVSEQSHIPCSETVNCINADGSFYHSVSQKQIVSSSMVISENLYAPYAVVCGYVSGEIEVVNFNLFQGLDSPGGSLSLDKGSHLSRKSFSGHEGAILCLAAHRMSGGVKGCGFNQVLVSGSMDCTIRIWDLDNGNLIMVMHHHVGPVHQIILPPSCTEQPWSDCFLSVSEDSCVALTSLETLQVERMFPGHPDCPARVVWDGARGYIACLSHDHSRTSDSIDVLYIWDIKTGARERVLRGMAAHSMFDHFCKGISMNSISGTVLNGNTSVSSLLLPISEDGNLSRSQLNNFDKGATLLNINDPNTSHPVGTSETSRKVFTSTQLLHQSKKQPIKCFCPYPGIAAFSFDLAAIINPFPKDSIVKDPKQGSPNMKKQGSETQTPHHMTVLDDLNVDNGSKDVSEEHHWISSLEQYLIGFSLSFLHFWHVDHEVDKLLVTDMKLKKPDNFIISAGLQGDKGSLTLAFPDFHATLELWKTSPEFCAMRSLTMVSLAQHMISLFHSSSTASSALAAFYTRNFAEKFPQIKAPLLQLLVSFWQNECEHVRMAARSLFHCAASRAIPLPLCVQQVTQHAKPLRILTEIEENELDASGNTGMPTAEQHSECDPVSQDTFQAEEAKLLEWLESYEMQDWISCVGGTSQDAMTSHIMVAAALAIWYPSLVKPSLATVVVHPLVKLVMAMNEKCSSTAAELLAEGMEGTWKACIGSEIPHLIADIFFQIECVSGPSANSAVPVTIRETLVETLLPSLVMADILAFLNVIESQIWSTSSDSPVHTVSLMTLIRVMRFAPRSLAQYLDKVVNFILQTMDPTNTVMRKTCIQSSLAALKEVTRAFPMVALNDSSTKLAVGDALGEIGNTSIRVYDIQSVTKIKVLDASGPPGLPSLLPGTTKQKVTTLISALKFSPDGEGLVAFSEHGLMIRWWSLGSAWWEKLSRNLAPVQCTKLIFVPPWEGFSSNTSRSSVIASVMGHDNADNFQEIPKSPSYADGWRHSLHNLDLSYQLEWIEARKVILMRQGVELGSFLL